MLTKLFLFLIYLVDGSLVRQTDSFSWELFTLSKGEGWALLAHCAVLLLQKTIKPRNCNAISEHNGTVTRAPKSTRPSSRHVAEDKQRDILLSREREEIPLLARLKN